MLGPFHQPADTDNDPSTASDTTNAEVSLAYMNERAEACAARWLPSIFMDMSFNDFTDWMEWCVPYVTGVLRRP
eukprot:4296431-Pyramimonas_sp.AAC.2